MIIPGILLKFFIPLPPLLGDRPAKKIQGKRENVNLMLVKSGKIFNDLIEYKTSIFSRL